MLRALLIAAAAPLIAFAQTTTTTILTVSANPVLGKPVTLTAIVSPATYGVVEFTDDFEILGTAQLDGDSQAALQYVFRTPGRYRLRAVFRGNPNFAPSRTAILPTHIGSLPVSSFGQAQPYSPTTQTRAIDANLDGRADEFKSSVTLPNGIEYESVITFEYGDSGGNLTPVLTNQKGGSVNMQVARLNTDDIADAFYSVGFRRSNFSTCGFYLSTGPSSWTDNSGCQPAYIRTDVNGDNLDDFINPGVPPVSGRSVVINQLDSFSVVPLMHPGTLIYVGDWDGDSRADLLVSAGSDIQLLIGNGNGLFKLPVTIATLPTTEAAFSVTEANGDGIPDLLLQTSTGYTLYPGQSPSLPNGIFVSPAVANFTSGKPSLFTVTAPPGTSSFQLILNSSLSAPGGCLIEVNPLLRTIRLQRNAAWVGTIPFGSGMLTNGICSVYGAGANLSTTTGVSASIPIALSGAASGVTKSFIRVVSGSTTTAFQAGIVNLQTTTPSPVAARVNPSVGSGSSVTFRVLADSQNGDVALVNVLINDQISAAQACLVEVNVLTQTARLLDAAGTTWSSAAGLGLAQQLSNGKCVIDISRILITPQGTSVYVDLPFSFLPGFNGLKNVYALVTAGGIASGWQPLGTWRIPATPALPSFPEVRSIAPISSFGKTATTTAVFGNAADSLYLGYLLFLPTPNVVQYTAQGTCLIEYNKISNGIRLINDAGDNWLGPQSGEVIRPGAPVLANDICSVDVSKVVISRTADAISETVTVEFSDSVPFGPMGTFLQAFDVSGFYTGMTQFGNWVAKLGNTAYPFLVSGSAYSGGPFSAINATATFASPNLASAHILIGSSISDPAPCHIVYLPGPSATPLYLINDSGTGLVGPVNNLVSNSRCTLDLAASSVTTSQSPAFLVSIGASLTFNRIFAGPKNIYSAAFDNDGKTTHWVLNGTFTAQ